MKRFVEGLDRSQATFLPSYHPSVLLKLCKRTANPICSVIPESASLHVVSGQ